MGDRIEQGRQAYDRGEYETAVAAFSSHRDVCRQWGDKRGEASALMDLGVTHQRMDNLADAQLAYEQALEIFNELDDTNGKAMVMGNLATLMKRQGAASEAEPLLQKSADMFYQLGKDSYEADTLRLLAIIQLKRGAFLDSIISYNRAMSRMDVLSMSQKVLRLLSNFLLRALGVQMVT